MGRKYLFGSPSSLLIRSDLIRARQRFYDESTLHGDKIACLDILREADFGFVHQVLTFTRRHNESATSFIRKYETYKLGTLQGLILYGDWFFSKDEFEKCLKYNISRYYRFLSKKMIEIQGTDFLEYHKKELSKLDLNLSYSRLSIALLWELLNVRNSGIKLLRGLRNSKQSKVTNPNEVKGSNKEYAS